MPGTGADGGLHVIERPPRIETAGAVSLVALVHGSMDRGSTFNKLAIQLTDCAVVFYDRRGYAGDVLQNVRDRSIILMHDGGGRRDETLLALKTVIPTLKARGYHFVTVQQLLDPLAPVYGPVSRLRTPPPPGISLESPSR